MALAAVAFDAVGFENRHDLVREIERPRSFRTLSVPRWPEKAQRKDCRQRPIPAIIKACPHADSCLCAPRGTSIISPVATGRQPSECRHSPDAFLLKMTIGQTILIASVWCVAVNPAIAET